MFIFNIFSESTGLIVTELDMHDHWDKAFHICTHGGWGGGLDPLGAKTGKIR